MSISKILFPDFHKDIQSDYLANIPSRSWQVITRFAPSPTGFLHIWWVYTSLISQYFAHQNDGKFILRIEDTDQNRKIENWTQQIVQELAGFGIIADEGPFLQTDGSIKYIWDHWPYIQSERLDSYLAMACKMLDMWLAYPCFLTSEELDEIRKIQTVSKQPTGIYGHFSKCRNLTTEQIQDFVNAGKTFVIRLKSPAKLWDRTSFHDLVKWFIEIDDNFEDVILLKSDGFPTYHFAHIVDDYMMGTSHVIRTDERLASAPKHIQIYNILLNAWILNAPIWKYAHASPVMKNDNGNRRKLSKRKDPEAKASFFTDVGYPIWAVREYLLTIIDTKYNDAKSKDINAVYGIMDFANFSTAGAIMDIQKLDHFSAEYIYAMDLDLLVNDFAKYINNFDSNKFESNLDLQNEEIYKYISSLKLLKTNLSDSSFIVYLKNILLFDRDKKFHKNYLDIVLYILPFVDEYFNNIDYMDSLTSSPIGSDIQQAFKPEYMAYAYNIFDENWVLNITKEKRFEDLKWFATKYNIALTNWQFKEWEASWNLYIAKIWDLAALLRIYIYGSTTSPDLYNMIWVIGRDKVLKRLSK